MKQSRQMIEERRSEIVQLLSQRDRMRVEELSKHFRVSELTIRRDLEELEKKEKVVRFFGGAQIRRVEDVINTFPEKAVSHMEEKRLIAARASQFAENEMSIFMNSGTTVLETMKCLKDKNVVIITNNALAGMTMGNCSCDILCTGGVYYADSCSYVGEYAGNLVQTTYADLALMGVNGLSAEAGITTSVFQETVLIQSMLRRCGGRKVVLADSSKIGCVRKYKSVDIDSVDVVVTTSKADPGAVERIREVGVEVIFADLDQKK